MASTIQVRRDTLATWASRNPTLAAGEIGFETDTNKLKIGTGSTAWNSLAYNYDPAAAAITGGTATGLTVNNIVLPPCANDFDPTVSGLATVTVNGVVTTIGIGAIIGTVDLLKAWQKWGTGATQWEAIHDTVTTLGAAGTIITVPDLHCDTLGGFEVLFEIDAAVTAYQQIWLQVNGSESLLWRAGHIFLVGDTGTAPLWVSSNQPKAFDINYSAGVTGRTAAGLFRCSAPSSTNFIRIIEAELFDYFGGGGHYYIHRYQFVWSSVAELATIGLRSDVTGGLAGTTKATLRRI